ncbi:MAG: hypothetical protein M1826_000224 [Phylliscum demangeonii]|nr:MAG: hypothetical protein M1826_000224 [Phylliscum demangeonii]
MEREVEQQRRWEEQRRWEQQRRWEEQRRLEELETDYDEDPPGMPTFVSDELYFTGMDPVAYARAQAATSMAYQHEPDVDRYDHGWEQAEGELVQMALRDKEAELVRQAHERIRRAHVLGHPDVNLSPPELDALERDRERVAFPAHRGEPAHRSAPAHRAAPADPRTRAPRPPPQSIRYVQGGRLLVSGAAVEATTSGPSRRKSRSSSKPVYDPESPPYIPSNAVMAAAGSPGDVALLERASSADSVVTSPHHHHPYGPSLTDPPPPRRKKGGSTAASTTTARSGAGHARSGSRSGSSSPHSSRPQTGTPPSPLQQPSQLRFSSLPDGRPPISGLKPSSARARSRSVAQPPTAYVLDPYSYAPARYPSRAPLPPPPPSSFPLRSLPPPGLGRRYVSGPADVRHPPPYAIEPRSRPLARSSDPYLSRPGWPDRGVEGEGEADAEAEAESERVRLEEGDEEGEGEEEDEEEEEEVELAVGHRPRADVRRSGAGGGGGVSLYPRRRR